MSGGNIFTFLKIIYFLFTWLLDISFFFLNWFNVRTRLDFSLLLLEKNYYIFNVISYYLDYFSIWFSIYVKVIFNKRFAFVVLLSQ